jgi:DNA-binding Lrp family transcriptional regulator
MTQQDRDRLVALKKARKGLITQREAAEEIGQSERHIRRLLKKLASKGDAAVVHALRGRRSNRKLDEKTKRAALKILGGKDYAGFGPTLASEYLADKHDIHAGRETVRNWMIEGKLWRAKQQHIEKIHEWRQRRSRVGELVQWDTSEHAWLEERGPKLYLISMIDDASSRVHARFVMHDSTQENMRLLWSYLERYGRPVGFYTDKASLFQTATKIARDQKELPRDEREPLPPTQIGRALAELNIVWIAAHSPQAKGRVERSFQTAQDRLVKGLRVAGAGTLEQANTYLETKFLPWWNQTLTVVPASADDAHRGLDATHSLAASLSYVETRQVNNDYTIQFDNKIYQIARDDIRVGMRGANVRVEVRLDASLAVRFRGCYLTVSQCHPRPKASPAPKARKTKTKAHPADATRPKSQWMKNFIHTTPEKAALSGLLPPLPAPPAKPIR